MEVRNNQSKQHEDLIDQLSNANEEIMNLISKNESLGNDLIIERQISERLKNDLNTDCKCHKCKKHGHKAFQCRSKSFNLAEQLVKAIFG